MDIDGFGGLMDDSLLLALAREGNATPLAPERATAAGNAVRHINKQVSEAALRHIGIDRRAESFETFRAHFVAKDEPSRNE